MAERHVVGDGAQLARARQGEGALVVGDRIVRHEHSAVALPVRLFEHLALAATAGPLVGDYDALFVGSDDLHGRAMHGDPVLGFAEVEQHTVNPLLGARARVEVVAEQLVLTFEPVVHDDLFAVEMAVTEGRGDVDHGLGREALGHFVEGHDAL